jgi:hypothetical protein
MFQTPPFKKEITIAVPNWKKKKNESKKYRRAQNCFEDIQIIIVILYNLEKSNSSKLW